MIKATNHILKRGTDYAAGWEIGRNLGLEKIGKGFVRRSPPDHLTGARYCKWTDGYEDGLRDRKRARRKSIVKYDGEEEQMSGTIGQILTRLEKRGVVGNVTIITPAGKIHSCGI